MHTKRWRNSKILKMQYMHTKRWLQKQCTNTSNMELAQLIWNE